MNHEEAKSSLAAERYILNEMPEPEAEGFEEHFFDCQECAQDVRDLSLISAGAKKHLVSSDAVRPATARMTGWLESLREWWSRPGVGLAAAAAILWLTLLSAYQARELRHQFKPTATASFLLLPESRGELTSIAKQDAGPVVVLEVDLPGAYGALNWDVRKSGEDAPVSAGGAASPRPGNSMKVVLPSSYLPAGEYSLNVRSSAEGGKLWLFRFQVL